MGVLLEVLSCSGISGALEVHFLYWGCASCPVSPRWEREIFRKVNSALSRIPLHVLVCVSALSWPYGPELVTHHR